MKVLLTGATSLTGFWFARALQNAGHEVVCLLTRENQDSYLKSKAENRFKLLKAGFPVIYSAPFGSEKFITTIEEVEPDVLALHGSHIPDYKSQSFDIADSLGKNLHNLHNTFLLLQQRSLPFVLTGTVFEPGEGCKGEPSEAGSPYGLAKGLTAQVFKYYAQKYRIPMCHFIIPNPFGIFEDKKFNYYLMDCWLNARTAQVKTPAYIRDNIPAPLLALVYVKSCSTLFTQTDLITAARPSGYAEPQGKFVERMASHVREFLKFPCHVDFLEQTDFSEPLARQNSENSFQLFPVFSETDFWREYADYYARIFRQHTD